MKRIILIMALVMVFSLAGINRSAFAIDEKLTRETLKGFKGVYVDVKIKPDLDQAGLSKSQILTDIELKLRLAGIKVLTEEEWIKEKGEPTFYISVTSLKPRGGLITYYISFRFYQVVFMERNPSIEQFGSTWSVGVLSIGDIKDFRANIKDGVDRFINAYLSVNLKK